MAEPFTTTGPDANGEATISFTEHYGTPPRPPLTTEFAEHVRSATRVYVDPRGYSLGVGWLTFIANVTEEAKASDIDVVIGPLTKHSRTAADICGLTSRLNIIEETI